MKQFRREFYLAGGTAIALHIGHRRSIDFDLFKPAGLNHKRIISKIAASGHPYTITWRTGDQMNINVGDTKITFLEYPFKIDTKRYFEEYFRTPHLLDLAAMKAYSIGRRSKWKDYVDLYYILKSYYSIQDISVKANEIYGQLFSEKLFRVQLSYFDDIDDSEAIDYVADPVSEDEVKDFLIEKATDL